jgi:hypothetical protein
MSIDKIDVQNDLSIRGERNGVVGRHQEKKGDQALFRQTGRNRKNRESI